MIFSSPYVRALQRAACVLAACGMHLLLASGRRLESATPLYFESEQTVPRTAVEHMCANPLQLSAHNYEGMLGAKVGTAAARIA